MQSCHLTGVVSTHLISFPNFFLSFLGKRFLTKYYSSIIQHDYAIKVVLVRNNLVIGFIVGSLNPSGLYRSLIKNDLLSFALAALPGAIKRPKNIVRLLRALNRPNSSHKGYDTAELTSFAIVPEYQQQGFGQSLLSNFIHECKSRLCQIIYLTTDAHENNRVNDFYLKSGFKLVRTYRTPEGRMINEYCYDL